MSVSRSHAVALCVVSLLLLSAPLAIAADPAPLAGVANPAAVYCAALGYEFEIVASPQGEVGICTLPDGVRVDAWDFFRGKCGREYSYCARQGYKTVTVDIGSGSYTAECAACADANGTILGTVTDMMDLFSYPAFDQAPMLAPASSEEAPQGPAAPHARGAAPSHPQGDRELPSYFDWRDYGGCTPIKNQAQCGSCWAFSTVAPLECNILIKDGITVDLSEQWIVSCNRDGWSCGGGWYAHNYHMWKTDECGGTGPVLEADFPYAAQDLPCDCPYPHQSQYMLRTWDYIGEPYTIPSVDEMKQAILDHGPISIALSADGAFGSYTGGVYTDCDHTNITHAVALVGWDDSQGSEGVWFLRNSWGPGWGEGGYMRIPYGCNMVGYNSCWVDYPGLPQLTFSHPNGLPDALLPEQSNTLTVQIDNAYDEYVPGSGLLHYRYDGGEFATVALTQLGRGVFEGVLPAPACSATPEFYFSAAGLASGTHTDPEGAPDAAYSALVGTLIPLFSDDFENDTGWTVENEPGLTDGPWDRGMPANGGRGDPPADYDGSGQCYVTDNVAGNSDVDGGATKLLSPVFDLAGEDRVLASAAIWYTNFCGDDPHDDVFEIFVSNNGGTDWVLARSLGPHTAFGWTVVRFMVNDYVDLTDQVRFQFMASDRPDGSIVEAGVDAFALRKFDCGISSAAETDLGPVNLALHASLPSPSVGRALIRYQLSQPGPIELGIYTVGGRMLRMLVNGAHEDAGMHSITWDGRDALGQRAPSGIYCYRLVAEGRSLTRKLMLVE